MFRKLAVRAQEDIEAFQLAGRRSDVVMANAYCRAGAPAYIFLESGIKQGFVLLAGRQDRTDLCLLVASSRSSGRYMSFPLRDFQAQLVDLSTSEAARDLWIRTESLCLLSASDVSVAIRVRSGERSFSFAVPSSQMGYWVHTLGICKRSFALWACPCSFFRIAR